MSAKGKVLAMRPNTKPQKTTQTVVDTIMFTPAEAEAWQLPPFQRPLTKNERTRDVIDVISESGVLPGVLTFAVFGGTTYLLDGQHRRYCFLASGSNVGFADIRRCYFDNMADMAAEYRRLNSRIATMKPDDFLRAMECSCPPIELLRAECPFVGYDNIRRNDKAPIISMSKALRAWENAMASTPASHAASAEKIAEQMTMQEAENLIKFLKMAMAAWGRDPQYQTLWSGLNLVMCMWLYRRTVLEPPTSKLTKATKIDGPLFSKCMMSLSADTGYVDWLRGRRLGESDRNPCYTRLKAIFGRRVMEETKQKALFIQPEWAD